jgi:hypothetical protein
VETPEKTVRDLDFKMDKHIKMKGTRLWIRLGHHGVQWQPLVSMVMKLLRQVFSISNQAGPSGRSPQRHKKRRG